MFTYISLKTKPLNASSIEGLFFKFPRLHMEFIVNDPVLQVILKPLAKHVHNIG